MVPRNGSACQSRQIFWLVCLLWSGHIERHGRHCYACHIGGHSCSPVMLPGIHSEVPVSSPGGKAQVRSYSFFVAAFAVISGASVGDGTGLEQTILRPVVL